MIERSITYNRKKSKVINRNVISIMFTSSISHIEIKTITDYIANVLSIFNNKVIFNTSI